MNLEDVYELGANTFLEGIFMCVPSFLVCARFTTCVRAHKSTVERERALLLTMNTRDFHLNSILRFLFPRQTLHADAAGRQMHPTACAPRTTSGGVSLGYLSFCLSV